MKYGNMPAAAAIKRIRNMDTEIQGILNMNPEIQNMPAAAAVQGT